MDIDLPKFPSPSIAVAPGLMPIAPEKRPRHVVANLGLVIAIVVLYIIVGRMADAVKHPQQLLGPPQPLEFATVMERYQTIVSNSPGYAEVQRLLGPPTHRGNGSIDAGYEASLEHSNRHVGIPPNRVWLRWIDPKDENRWVEILYAGHYVDPSEHKMYGTHKNGF